MSVISNMTEAAIALNELYVSLKDGGFTDNEALYLTGQVLTNTKQDGEQ